jgi:uncharacterized protein YigA (DUF484 family)
MRNLKVIKDAEAYNQHLKATQKLDAEIKVIEKKAAETKKTALQGLTLGGALYQEAQIEAEIARVEKKEAEEKRAMLNFLLGEEDAEWEVVAEDEEWEQVSKEEADDKKEFFSSSGLRMGNVRGGLQ